MSQCEVHGKKDTAGRRNRGLQRNPSRCTQKASAPGGLFLKESGLEDHRKGTIPLVPLLRLVSTKPMRVDMVLTAATLHLRGRREESATKVGGAMPFLGYGQGYIRNLVSAHFCLADYGVIKPFLFNE